TECARAMGQHVVREGGTTDDQRLKYAFRLCVAREPSGDELADLTKLMQKQRQRLRAHELDPGEVATGHRGKDASELEPAVYTLVSRALLNLDETITRE